MLKIAVPQNDQSIYELTTESGKKYFVRCPGMHLDDEREGLFCFLVEDDLETPVMFLNVQSITSFVRRPDMKLPQNANTPRWVLDLMSHAPGEGVLGFQTRILE